MEFGKLYVVATPIGNLSDISPRAVDILSSVSCIYAEDTRVAKKLTSSIGINTSIDSYHQHSDQNKMDQILNRLVSGEDLALVTDAGTPGISDPGNELIEYIYSREPKIKVLPIPGPSALAAALSVSGFNVNQFLFLGFLPKKKILKTIQSAIEAEFAICYFDSPHRVIKNLERILPYIKNRRVFVAREMTKIHETHYRGNIKDVLKNLNSENNLKGELVVIIEGKV